MTRPAECRIGRHWSSAGLLQGLRLALPAMPVMAVFGIAFGAVAARKGLTLLEATLMSTFVFAGASQLVALELWTDSLTVGGVAAIGLFTATVNMRFILMSASLHPWLGGLPAWQTYPALSLMTDPGWLLIMRYRAEGGSDPAAFLSSGFMLWLVWIATTVPGHLLGSFVTEPARIGIDLIMPCFFVVMLVPLWRGPRRAVAWAVAGAGALLTSAVVPGWWFIMVGAVLGGVAGGFFDGRD